MCVLLNGLVYMGHRVLDDRNAYVNIGRVPLGLCHAVFAVLTLSLTVPKKNYKYYFHNTEHIF